MGGTSWNGRTAGALTALAVLVIGLSVLGLAMSPGTSDTGVPGGSGDHSGSGAHASSHDPASMGVGPPPVWEDGTPAVPDRHTGPQGRTGQFVARCTYSHSASSDPIVWFGQAGRSHRHDFYGSTLTGDSSTADRLQGSPTTCDKPGDSAAYWQPTLYDDGRPVEPVQIQAYYRVAPGIEPTDVRPFPPGLTLIAGDALATTPQHGEAAGWTCGTRTALTPAPTECSPTAPLHMVLTFPDCWDGTNLNSADHRSHATYSRDGACPTTTPHRCRS